MAYSDENLPRYLSGNEPLEELSQTAAQMGYSCWMVGGALRDVLLGRPVTDVDLVATSDPTPLAQQWAKQQDAHWFWLDKERRQSRVLLRYGKLQFYFDFAPLRAETLERDLFLRDFTINAIAVPLISPLSEQALIDPLQGRTDLLASSLRDCSEQSLKDDPLRILKGIRHCVILDMRIARETESRMCDLAVGLSTSAGERKRNELGRIFSSGSLEEGLTLLDRCQLLPILFDQPGKSFSVGQAATELLALERVLDQWTSRQESMTQLFEEAFDETINRRTLYLLAMFLRHYRSAELEVVLADRLRLSRRAVMTILKLVNLDFASCSTLEGLPDRSRVKALWMESQGPAAVDQLIFYALVDQPKFLSAAVVQKMLEDFTGIRVHGRIPDLLGGRDIKQLLPDLDDRQIGCYQKAIKEAEITGEISSPKEAREWLLTENSIDKN